MAKNFQSFYEKFHKNTKFQKRIIKPRNFTYRLVLEAINPYLNHRKKFLDIGCGAGTLSFYVANKGNYVKGIDISSRTIKICRINAERLGLNKNIYFQAADFLKIKKSEKFDYVLCNEVLEHLDDDKKTILKIYNELKDNGIAIISVPSKDAPLLKFNFMKEKDRDMGHLRRYNSEELTNLLKMNNFSIIKTIKNEGIIRNLLFITWLGNQIIRIANKLGFVSDILTFFDDITLKLLGESNIIVIAKRWE